MFSTVDPKQHFPELEEEILKFWEKNDSFRKSIELRESADLFEFYDGPPFATGLPHYGHILAGTIKDVIPRYQTMRGKKVPRRFGWDCHGLPVENLIEKELKLKDLTAIKKYGEANFCESCRNSVLRYTSEWEETVKRMGRWVDFRNDYKTMEPRFMESVWWVFKKLWDNNLVYKGLKPMHICPRCVTPLSNFEVSLGYQDLTDFSITIKFKCLELKNTYFLAWTTTPWTLAGNSGLAIHPDYEYVKIEIDNSEILILAKELLVSYKKELGDTPKIIETIKGKDLESMNLTYEPLFQFFEKYRSEGSFRLVTGDFVKLNAGTGIVHIAPAFGEDDLILGKEKGIPAIHHVSMDGKFITELVKNIQIKYSGFKDIPVKEVGNNRRFDEQIVWILEQEKKLFKKDNEKHSYPTCWRCETPLLNYATSSWFVKVEQLKERLLLNNEKIHWMPDHIKNGRFGKWLEGVRDWAISRTRYWGTPLPVWECESCGEYKVIDSIEELEKYVSLNNEYYFMRHGEARHNKDYIVCSSKEVCNNYPLTDKGRDQAKISAKKAKELGVNLIISSDLKRAEETADIVANETKAELKFHKGLREWDLGDFDGKTLKEWYESFPKDSIKRIYEGPKNGESLVKLGERIKQTIYELENEYKGKKILIISHSSPLACLRAKLEYLDNKSMLEDERMQTGELIKFNFNHGIINDLHKHKIDHIKIKCPKCKGEMKRITEVFDCWFESGSMPYAQDGLKENTKLPADFIAEGLDQTRGWFYTLHVLASGLFNLPSFKNCIVNGIVLSEDGKKMSKSKKNYPDPSQIFNNYGADAMRFYLMNSSVTLADNLCFSEKGVKEVMRNVILPLWNAYLFFITYANADSWEPENNFNFSVISSKLKNSLDIWIISEFEILKKEVTEKMDDYNLSKGASPFPNFIENLTNWYIRRSRRRFWDKFGTGDDNDKKQAYSTLYYILKDLCKLLAPFCPFITEKIFQNLKLKSDFEGAFNSVHHQNWPKYYEKLIDLNLSKEVEIVQNIITLGLSLRKSEKIKVRQPLKKVEIVISEKYDISNHIDTIKEELNVKEVKFLDKAEEIADIKVIPNARLLGPRFGSKVQEIIKEAKSGNFYKNEDGSYKICGETLSTEEIGVEYIGKAGKHVVSFKGIVVTFDFEITEDLKLEGKARDLVRIIQEMRKEANYNVSDRIIIELSDSDIKSKFGDYILGETLGSFGKVKTPDIVNSEIKIIKNTFNNL